MVTPSDHVQSVTLTHAALQHVRNTASIEGLKQWQSLRWIDDAGPFAYFVCAFIFARDSIYSASWLRSTLLAGEPLYCPAVVSRGRPATAITDTSCYS